MEKNSFTIMDILYMMMHHWIFILVTVVVFAGGAFVKTHYFSTPSYTAEGSLYISNVNKDKINSVTNQKTEVTLNELVTSQELLKSYVQVLKTDRFLERVKTVSNLRYSLGTLKSMIKMESLNNTEILNISAVATNPNDAYILVETIISLAKDEIEWVFEGGTLKILDYPTYQATPLSLNTTRNTAVAGMIGFVLAAAIVFILELSDKRVRTHDDITEKYDYYILGEIPSFNAHK